MGIVVFRIDERSGRVTRREEGWDWLTRPASEVRRCEIDQAEGRSHQPKERRPRKSGDAGEGSTR